MGTTTTRRPTWATRPTTTSRPLAPVVGEETDAIVVEAQPQQSLRCKEGSYRVHQGDCTRYYLCLYGQWVLKQCPSGTSWSVDRCDWTTTKCNSTIPVQGRNDLATTAHT